MSLLIALLAAVAPSSYENINPAWLAELHSKLWGRHDLFNQIFRTANLTKTDFIQLQLLLERNDPSRRSPSYEAQNVLDVKADFLRKKSCDATAILEFDTARNRNLVPSVINSTSVPLASLANTSSAPKAGSNSSAPPVLAGAMNVDANADSSEADSADSNLALQFPTCPGYILADATELSTGSAAVFPCIIRYMDLTALKLEYLTRVPHLMLIRDEWQTMIDIFNGRKGGVNGSAAFIGSPGIGEHYSEFALAFNQDHRRQNLYFVLHPNPMPHPSSAGRLSRHGGACFLHHRRDSTPKGEGDGPRR